MRWIGRSIVVMLMLGCMAIFLRQGLADFWRQRSSAPSDIEQARASTFFPLGREQWINFDIPKQSDLYRFYAHAALKPGIEDRPVRYTVDYQWLDQQGSLLEERQHHITTRANALQTDFDDISTGNVLQGVRFYDHQRSVPSRDHALYFNSGRQPEARLLRLRVAAMDDYIEQIGIRPFQQYHRPQESVDLSWQRMSLEQRELISRGSLYPTFLLSEYERKNLLSSYWKPIGPLGVLEKDYSIGTLYQLDADAAVVPPQTPATDGLFASPQHWVTLVLQGELSRYRIEWQPLPEQGTPHYLQLHWQGVDFQNQRQWRVPVRDHYWEGSLENGLLQVVPDQPGVMRLDQWRGSEWHNITPPKRYSRTFYCFPDAPLDYTLAPGTDPQSLKIDARAFFRQDQPSSAEPTGVGYQLLGAAGSKLYEYRTELPTLKYPHQHFPDAVTVASYVFEPLTRYLDASAASQTLRIDCSAPSLISVYSRPWRHPINRKLPAHENYWYSYEEREPAWFTLLPTSVNSLIRQKHYHSLLWYFRPMGLDSMLSEGNYSWQGLESDDTDALEFQVFSTHSSDSQSRMEARGSAYRPLTEPDTLRFAGSSNEKLIQPSAVYLRESAKPQPVQVLIDHSLVLETTIAGKSGRIRLPRISAGRHHIEIRAEGTRWFINNTAQTDQTHLLRIAYLMMPGKDTASSLAFTFDSSGIARQLGIWLYAPAGSETVNCRLSLQARRRSGVLPEHSLRDFHYQISSGEYERAHVLQRRETAALGPVRLLVTLQPDLPAQTMTAHLGCDQPGVLASAGLVSEGLSAYRYFEERHEAY